MSRRTLFRCCLAAAFMVATGLTALLGSEAVWAHQRREFRRFPQAVTVHFVSIAGKPRTPPSMLRLFGEKGVSRITFKVPRGEPISAMIEQHMVRAKSLYPEAAVDVSSASDWSGQSFAN
ncbi:MAG TPA: hypothetical protein VL175_18635 [Pirellulales bacterium]|jgi:hypothetical protein|nr:hypothetical protein [Pirellulales bacterium]